MINWLADKKKAWNKGYATEAAIAFLHYGFEKLRFKNIYSFTSSFNKASGKVMQQNGMIKEGEFNHAGIAPAIYYAGMYFIN